jgi:hypothetical protein
MSSRLSLNLSLSGATVGRPSHLISGFFNLRTLAFCNERQRPWAERSLKSSALKLEEPSLSSFQVRFQIVPDQSIKKNQPHEARDRFFPHLFCDQSVEIL